MREVGKSSLDEQSRTENIDGITLVEVTRVDVTKGDVGGDASVVDDDVDLEFARFWMREVILCCGDDVFGTRGLTDVCLDGHGADSMGGREGGRESGCFFSGGG